MPGANMKRAVVLALVAMAAGTSAIHRASVELSMSNFDDSIAGKTVSATPRERRRRRRASARPQG